MDCMTTLPIGLNAVANTRGSPSRAARLLRWVALLVLTVIRVIICGMLEAATGFRRDVAPGRWVIEGKRGRTPWEVIVEPDHSLEILVVITAYPA